jgi:hypothetical protein
VAGAIVTLIPVTGSRHEAEVVELVVVADVVVHTTAVLAAGVPWQDVKVNKGMRNAM